MNQEYFITAVITPILESLISLLVAAATAYLFKLFKKAKFESEKVKNESTKILVNNTIDTTYDIMSNIIDKLEVTLVKELKKTTADGKLTKEDAKEASKAAIELFNTISNNELKTALDSVVGDTNKYLQTIIDSIVLNKKNQK